MSRTKPAGDGKPDGTNTKYNRPYGLLELETGNMVGFFTTERAALSAVVDSIDRHGAEAVATLALAHFVRGDVEAVAQGEELARRALAFVREAVPPTRARAKAKL